MAHEVEITGLAFGGKGVGRIDGKVVFVPFTAPGDLARVIITKDKKGFSEGRMAELLRPSPSRQAPACPLFGLCGGCGLQHMDYKEQVRWKDIIFRETLKRIGKVESRSYDEPTASPQPLHYRSRARFQVEGASWGFFEPGTHRAVDIEACPILDPRVNDIFGRVKKVLLNGWQKNNGPLYALEIGVSERDGKAVAAFHVTDDRGFPVKDIEAVEGLKGFEVRVGELRKGHGDRRLFYSAGGMDYSVTLGVFSQVNRAQNAAVMERVLECAGLGGPEKVADLFSGAANLSLALAKRAAFVTAVESNPEAVLLAEENARANSVFNVRFEAQDAFKWTERSIKTLEIEGIDVLVLDPPRGGESEVAKALSGLRPKKIVYVSCSPPTLARDISILTGCGYRLVRAGLFDMFPQTYHIESVVSLEL